MKVAIHRIGVILHFIILSTTLIAQEKKQYYYYTHESELLPDAKTAFQQGDYERAKELCLWYYVIVGSHAADNLRNQAERCSSLTQEMESFLAAEKIPEAREIAKAILSINPADSKAKEISQLPDSPKPDTLSLSGIIPKLTPKESVDTDAISTPTEALSLPPKEKGDVEIGHDSEEITAAIFANTKEIISEDKREERNQKSNFFPRNRFIVKGGIAFVLSKKDRDVFPSFGFGLYDMGGSHSGLELGAGPMSKYYSFYGLAYVLRIGEIVYPRLGLGVVIDSGEYRMPFTGFGVTLLSKKHFGFDIGACIYPKGYVSSSFRIGYAF